MMIQRHAEAFEYVQCIADPITRDLVKVGFGVALQLASREMAVQPADQDDAPVFDALFFVKALEEFVANKERLRSILNGVDWDPFAAITG
jgi:hypothetical protein